MEALAAVGLASSVIQFVDFSLKIYGKTVEIAESARGTSHLNAELKESCERLAEFNSKLSFIDSGNGSVNPDTFTAPGHLAKIHRDAVREHVTGVKKIAKECNLLCQQLLGILKELHLDPSNRFRFVQSLGMAVKEHFKSKKIAQLETKLKDFHSRLHLHIAALLDARLAYVTEVLEMMASKHQDSRFKQTTRFDELNSRLVTMSNRVEELVSQLREDTGQNHFAHNGVEDLESMLGRLRLSEKDVGNAAIEQDIVKSLQFEEMKLRHETIPEAHVKTFEWVLRGRGNSHPSSEHDSAPTTEDLPQPAPENDPELATEIDPASTRSYREGDFVQWLQSGRGVFWVTGKPGSGKSTLMKFVADHEETKTALESWAAGEPLVLASHYFWAIGTDMQKSQRGLLQKILFDVLRKCPQLAWDIFPGRCVQNPKNSSAVSFNLPEGDGWSLKELRTALALLSKSSIVGVKICFFIDGLDEYAKGPDGDHFELCRTLKTVSESKNLKCCVSSRPWNVFKDAFDGGESSPLWMHELTHNDIHAFAHDRLADIAGDTSVDRSSVMDLADIVAERAEGVFLWVFLVVEGLRHDIINSSTIEDLKKVVESLPTELDEYFRHTLKRVPGRHHQYMAKTFMLTLNGRESLRLRVYFYYESSGATPDFALSGPTLDKVFSRIKEAENCKKRINERCAGLLSFDRQNYASFIHRTVHDFLMTGPMQEDLKGKIGAVLLPNVAILESLIFGFRCEVAALIKTSKDLKHNGLPRKVSSAWHRCLDYVREVPEQNREAIFRLLDGVNGIQWIAPSKERADEVRAALDRHFNKNTVYLKTAGTQNLAGSKSVSAAAGDDGNIVKVNLKTTFLGDGFSHYVKIRLALDPDYFSVDGIAALATAVESCYCGNHEVSIALLELGHDPNQLLDSDSQKTPWRLLYDKSVFDWIDMEAILQFLKHGADKTFLLRVVGDGARERPRRFLIKCIKNANQIGADSYDLLRDVFGALLGTTEQRKISILEHMANISTDERWDRVKDTLQTLLKNDGSKVVLEIINLLTIEMVNAKIVKEAFSQWHSTWNDFTKWYSTWNDISLWHLPWNSVPVILSPTSEEKAREYLNLLKRRQPDDDVGFGGNAEFDDHAGSDEPSPKRPRTSAEP